jgi:hypothetical protein
MGKPFYKKHFEKNTAKKAVSSGKFVEAFRVNASGSTTKSNETGLLYEGGGSLKWMKFVAHFISRVTTAGLHRYIDGAKVVQPDGAVTWEEVTFTEAEPNVENIVTEGVATLQVAHGAAILRRSEFLNTNEGLTVQQRAEEMEKIAQRAEDYHFARQRAQLSLRSNAMTQHAAWTARKDKYDKDCKELSLQFLRSIEASTLQLVRGDLNAYRFSAAWSKLNAHFRKTSVNADNVEVLMSHLSALSFDPTFPWLSMWSTLTPSLTR